MTWAKGHQIQGNKYRIEEVLGEGGFGITYKALHILLNEQVVIKTPNKKLQNDPEYPKYLKRFQKEAQTLAKLSQTRNPHIVRVSDFFVEGEIPCLVMEFIAGESLWEVVQRKGKLPEAQALAYIRQIGSALAVVHKHGLVHRDAHPGNIMLPKPRAAILIDFGIVGDLVPAQKSSKAFANPAFAPYEQLLGKRGPTVDIYSLGASLYYAVTGQLPASSRDRWCKNQSLIPPKQHNPNIGDRLNQAVLKAMELEARDRPQSMQEWLNLLKPSQNSQAATSPSRKSSSYTKQTPSSPSISTAKTKRVLLSISKYLQNRSLKFSWQKVLQNRISRMLWEGSAKFLGNLTKAWASLTGFLESLTEAMFPLLGVLIACSFLGFLSASWSEAITGSIIIVSLGARSWSWELWAKLFTGSGTFVWIATLVSVGFGSTVWEWVFTKFPIVFETISVNWIFAIALTLSIVIVIAENSPLVSLLTLIKLCIMIKLFCLACGFIFGISSAFLSKFTVDILIVFSIRKGAEIIFFFCFLSVLIFLGSALEISAENSSSDESGSDEDEEMGLAMLMSHIVFLSSILTLVIGVSEVSQLTYFDTIKIHVAASILAGLLTSYLLLSMYAFHQESEIYWSKSISFLTLEFISLSGLGLGWLIYQNHPILL